jgi:hypothetical protein
MSQDAINLAICLIVRTGAGGLVLFIVPPFGEIPPAWQIQAAFLAAIAWCYWDGLFGRSRMLLASVEAGVSLWMSLKWTKILILLSNMAAL